MPHRVDYYDQLLSVQGHNESLLRENDRLRQENFRLRVALAHERTLRHLDRVRSSFSLWPLVKRAFHRHS